jgi:hypothetical protein
MVRSFAAVGLASALLLVVPGCATSTGDEDPTESSASELRALEADEILGEIHYGDRFDVEYTSTPRYRAWWFNGVKGDWINLRVASSTGDIRAWVTDDQFREQYRGAAMALRKTGKFYVVVREGELANATLTIDFKKRIPSTH